jgi:hypothetical protein
MTRRRFVAFQHPRIGRLDVLHRDHLDLRDGAVPGSEIEHFLGFGDAAD